MSAYFFRPLADVPNVLKCSCDVPRMRLGEPLACDIILSVTDKHGNKTGKVRSLIDDGIFAVLQSNHAKNTWKIIQATLSLCLCHL